MFEVVGAWDFIEVERDCNTYLSEHLRASEALWHRWNVTLGAPRPLRPLQIEQWETTYVDERMLGCWAEWIIRHVEEAERAAPQLGQR